MVVIQVLTPNNTLVHYQHLMTSNVSVGQQVLPGTIIGTGGGCPVGAYPNPLSSSQGCTSYDQYSSGQHIEVRVSPTYNQSGGVWNQAWSNPLQTFQQMAGRTVSQSISGLQNLGQSTGGQKPTGGDNSTYPATCPPFDIACGMASLFSSNTVRQVGLLFAGLILLLIGIQILFFGGKKEES